MIAQTQSPLVLVSSEPNGIDDVEFRDLSLSMQASPLRETLGSNLDLQLIDPALRHCYAAA